MQSNASSEIEKTISQLALGALFFAMRSCEYLHVNKNINKIERKTKLLRVRNFRFFKGHHEIDLSNTEKLHKASTIIITFEFQKNKEKFESVKLQANSSKLCPVKIWSTIIKRILSYPKGSLESSINMFREKRSYKYVTSADLRKYLRQTVSDIGEKRLGIKASEVGTHSIRSTFAMLLVLNKVPTIKIMKIGRWKSNSVFEYIRANVEDFSMNISKHIANASTGNFYTLPCFISTIKKA